VRTAIWATGFRHDCSWLGLLVFDRKGELRMTAAWSVPWGSMCLPGLRRRKSSFIHGAKHDVRELAADRGDFLGGTKAWPRSLAATPTGPVAAG
jgi:putative flavoprotein involved in K+ transport